MFSWEIEEFTYRQRQRRLKLRSKAAPGSTNYESKPHRDYTNYSQLRFCCVLGVQVVKNAFSWSMQRRLVFMQVIYLRFYD